MTAARANQIPRRCLRPTAIALVLVTIAILAIGLLKGVEWVREQQRRSQDNILQLGLAMYFYEDIHGSLPPAAVTDMNGKPLLSWRVLILPYIEQQELYKEFHLDEPWDSPHNSRLLDRMPDIYRPFIRMPSPVYPPNATCFRVFVGKGTLFEPGKSFHWADCDDPANTFLIVESAELVPWTKPEDLAVEPGGPFPPLGMRPGFVRSVMANGRWRVFDKPLNEAEIRPMVFRREKPQDVREK